VCDLKNYTPIFNKDHLIKLTIIKNLLRLAFVLFTTSIFSQARYIMQVVGSVNMSMGGASTAQPLEINVPKIGTQQQKF